MPTLRLDDNRLPIKEQVWGVSPGDEQVAYTRAFLEKNPVHNTTGGEPMVLVWSAQYETLGVFSPKVGGEVVEVSEIDVLGKPPEGTLKRLPQYPGAFWMVWSHWFPETKVMKRQRGGGCLGAQDAVTSICDGALTSSTEPRNHEAVRVLFH